MTGMLRVPRTRGVASGFLLILLGAWGALIPFIGPLFHFAYTPASAWTWTWGRFFLEVLPGAVALIGGLILLVSAIRPVAIAGASLAAAAGAWFAVGALLAPLWTTYAALGARVTVPAAFDTGTPTGGPVHVVLEHLAFFTGLGVAIVFLAGLALGRMAVVGVREAAMATRRAEERELEPAMAGGPAASETTDGDGQKTGLFRRLTSARSSADDS
jgi:hypothetical protein